MQKPSVWVCLLSRLRWPRVFNCVTGRATVAVWSWNCWGLPFQISLACNFFWTLSFFTFLLLWWVWLWVSLSMSVSQEPHIQTLPNFLCTLPVAMARSSFGSFAIVLYLLFCGWRCVFILWTQWQHVTNAASSLQHCASAKISAVWCWLCRVLDYSRCQN